jgi:hypothetical protein
MALAAALLAPSAWVAWRLRQMPQLGSAADDAIYWVCAKALAEGRGYRILSAPQQPWQTKYPPLYGAYLSLAWKFNPRFPENLPLATLLAWLWTPPFLALSYLTLVRLTGSRQAAVALTALLAVNPHLLYFGAGFYTEIPYACLLLASLWILERAGAPAARPWAAPAAGLLAGAASLVRTHGVALLASGALGLLLRRQARRAAAFAAAMLPALAGWFWWAAAHKYAGRDPALVYHTDYIRFHLDVVRPSDLPVLLWGNLGGALIRAGRLIVPTPGETGPERIFSIIVSVLALAGAWRLAKRAGWTQYHLYAVGHLLLLAPWHFPANARLLFPLAPLLYAGLLEECRHIWAMARAALRSGLRAQRTAGAIWLAVLAALALIGVWRWTRPLGEHYPQLGADYQIRRAGVEQAYRWIAEHTPAAATLVAWQDGLLYLRTGRHAAPPGISPVPLYTSGPDKASGYYCQATLRLAAEAGRDFFLVTSTESFIPDRTSLEAARRWLARNSMLKEVYSSPDAAIFALANRTRPAPDRH